jgi:hypothetical protein
MLFTISAFNSDVSMGTAGTFDASAAVALDTDADATLYISTTQMKIRSSSPRNPPISTTYP